MLAVVFVSAGGSKWLAREQFLRSLEDYSLPVILRSPLSLLVPAVEVVIGVAWLSSPFNALLLSIVTLATFSVLALFTLAILAQIRQGKRIRCGCSGVMGSVFLGWNSIARNATLCLYVVAPISVGRSGAEHNMLLESGTFGPVLLVGATCLLLLVVIAIDELIALEGELRRLGKLTLAASQPSHMRPMKEAQVE